MRYLLAIFMMGWLNISYAKELVVSTYPLYLIAKDVTAGIEEPAVLLTPQQTGHNAQLTPKNRQMIQNAELVVWLGAQYEVPLQSVLTGQKKAISILNSNIVKTLPLRDLKGEVVASDNIDTHVWLEPNNAVRIAFFIAALRSQQQPQYKEKYFENAHKFSKRMFDASNVLINTQQGRAYWAYHDAYQYLERSLQIKFAGALTADHELPSTAAQIKYLQQSRPQKKMCLLTEANVHQEVLRKLAPVGTVVVDESMSTQKDFVTAWLKLANSLQYCLKSNATS